MGKPREFKIKFHVHVCYGDCEYKQKHEELKTDDKAAGEAKEDSYRVSLQWYKRYKTKKQSAFTSILPGWRTSSFFP